MESVETASVEDGTTEEAGRGQGQMDLLLLKGAAATKEEPWRKVISLADLRKQYQDELDRIAAIQNNQFEFVMVREEDEDAMDES